MLKTRVMPIVLLNGYNVVKSIQFSTFRVLGNPITVSQVYESRGVDELVLLDIKATVEKRGPNTDIINDISSECFMPLTVGGGIDSVSQVREIIRSGADKVSINTAAVERPELIREIAREFGAQCVVASIDVRKEVDGSYFVYTHAGKVKTNLEAAAWAHELELLGAGEILLNSVDQDGTMKGYDLDLIKKVCGQVRVPVIACGGAGELKDFSAAIKTGGADAVAAASIYHFTSETPKSVKEFLRKEGVPVRL